MGKQQVLSILLALTLMSGAVSLQVPIRLTVSPPSQGATTRPRPRATTAPKATDDSSSLPISGTVQGSQSRRRDSVLNMVPPGLEHIGSFSTLVISVVDVFDGSTIVDPVIVSQSFWRGLQSQIFSALLGQILAAIVFSLVASFFASQLSGVRDFVMDQFRSATNNSKNDKTFIKATDLSSSSYDRPAPDYGKLLICLAIDIVGSSSELIPIFGELSDFITAPIAATVLQNLFGSNRILFVLELTEEILPFTDIIPLATLAWVVDTYFGESDVAQLLNLGKFGPTTAADELKRNYNFGNTSVNGVIDTKAERVEEDSKTSSRK